MSAIEFKKTLKIDVSIDITGDPQALLAYKVEGETGPFLMDRLVYSIFPGEVATRALATGRSVLTNGKVSDGGRRSQYVLIAGLWPEVKDQCPIYYPGEEPK